MMISTHFNEGCMYMYVYPKSQQNRLLIFVKELKLNIYRLFMQRRGTDVSQLLLPQLGRSAKHYNASQKVCVVSFINSIIIKLRN